ncbi:MAG TPA: hypothetical protein VNO52_06935, partial [Methylomirabilota bacterium]|nr:hypothetical protein [Methylomirabilota bacterium]
MIRTTASSLCFLLLLSGGPLAWAQRTATDDAVAESARREAFKIDLGRKLAEADEALKKGDYGSAATLYDAAVELARKTGTGVDAEKEQALKGLTQSRLFIADQYQRAGDYVAAGDQVARLLNVDPANAEGLAFKRKNDELLRAQQGRAPDAATLAKLPAIHTNQIAVGTRIQNGKLLYEAGKYDEAEKELRLALQMDPGNKAASYYLDKVQESYHTQEKTKRDTWSREMILDVTRAWNQPVGNPNLPVPNIYARTNLVHTGKGRQAIYLKLENIRLDEINYDGLPLSEVISALDKDVRKRDPENVGVNFIIHSNPDSVAPPAPAEAAFPGAIPGGQAPPPPPPPAEAPDIASSAIKLALRKVTLGQVLDAIQKVSSPPVK